MQEAKKGRELRKHLNVVSEEEMQWTEQFHGEKFGFRRKQLGIAAGGEKLGCSLYEVPSGCRAWPYHYHLANEEAVYVVEGSGTLRIGEEEIEIREGNYMAFPVGEKWAHQIVNTSDRVLRYLCFSTMTEPEVGFYPDSGKFVVFAGSAPGGPKEKRTLTKFLRADAEVGYWEGEE